MSSQNYLKFNSLPEITNDVNERYEFTLNVHRNKKLKKTRPKTEEI